LGYSQNTQIFAKIHWYMDKIPAHVAIVPDGNRRWARSHALEIAAGHKSGGMKILEEIIDEAINFKIPFLTLWVFSTENWKRDQKEIDGLMNIFRHDFIPAMEKIIQKGVRLLFIGDIERFPEDIVASLKKAKEDSKNNKMLTVTLAANYGGRQEIVKAVSDIISRERSRPFPTTNKDIKKEIDQNLESHVLGIPDPDLIIRTGGEKRLSGYLLWQSEYSELYFTDVLMPDFGRTEFKKAIEEYGSRQRRFGK
jgi:undecaprenyl diphosphate synthase